MLINLAFIKAVNGLFYFALDYIAELEDVTSAILVRSTDVAEAVRQRFPAAPVHVVTPWQAGVVVRGASHRGEMTFTPSSHPIPGCRRQLVVVHDTFPFEGRTGAVKAALFFFALRTSGGWAGYINRCDARAFLLNGGLGEERIRATPNHMTLPQRPQRTSGLIVPDRPVIGLFGTDSPKKNYDRLFAALVTSPTPPRLAIRMYGQPNAYTTALITAFPSLDLSVSDSTAQDLDTFIASVDILVSVATREGFSRPMAVALSMGVPCWVVDTPVFREFYGGQATFHRDIAHLSDALVALAPGTALDRPRFVPPAHLERDFRECLTWLRDQDAKIQ